MDTRARKRLSFDEYVLDPRAGCLRNTEGPIELRPKSFDVLYYFVQRPGQLITKDELFAALWPNVVVTDDSLVQCVCEIRRALRDDKQRMLRTVPRRGYMFTRAVTEALDYTTNADRVGADLAPRSVGLDSSPVAPARRGRILRASLLGAAVVALAAIVVAAGYVWHARTRSHDAPLFTLVVLPIRAASGDPSDERFADELTADITFDISRIANGFVIAPSVAQTYKQKLVDPKQVGRDLGVRYVLEGAVKRAGGTAWLNVDMVDAQTGRQVWAERFEGAARDLASLQRHVKGNFSRKVELELTEAEAVRARREPPEGATAENLVARGAALVERQTPDTLERARVLALRAVELDPNFIRGWNLLAATYFLDLSFRYDVLHGTRDEWIRRGTEAAARAYAIDPNHFHAIGMRGWALQWEGKFEDAMVFARRQIAMNPNFPQAYNRLALAKLYAGSPAEAIAVLKEGLSLAPPAKDSLARGNYQHNALSIMAIALIYLKRDAEAMVVAQKAIDIKPDFPSTRAYLAAAAANVGDMEKARASLAVFRQLLPGYTLGTFRNERGSDRTTYLAQREHFYEGLRKAGLED